MTRAEKIRVSERLRNKYEKAFRPLIKKALKNQYKAYTDALKEHGPHYVLDHQVANLIDGHLASTVQQLYMKTGVAKAEIVYRQLKRLPKIEKKKGPGPMGFNAQWTSDILSYFRLHLFDKVVLPISDTTQEYIRRVLNEGIAEGWGVDEMVSRINREDYLNGRTERILITETNRAINYGSQLAAESYEFKTQKRWIATHDDRTRPDHMQADGQTVDLDGSFSVGGEDLDFPGDPNGSAEMTVNCRCSSEIVAVRNAAGRLIPKDPNPVRVTGRLRGQVQEIIADLIN